MSPTVRPQVNQQAEQNLKWGLQHCHQGRWPKAIKNLRLALQQYTQAEHPIGIGKSLSSLSAVYLQTAQYDRALTCSQAAVAILEGTPNQQAYALAVYQRGVSHLKLGDLTLAEKDLEQTLALYHALGDRLNEDRVLLHLGQLYFERQEYMFALAAYESVLDSLFAHTLSPQAQELLFHVLNLMMQLCAATHQADEAIVPYQDVLNRYIATGNQAQIAHVFRQLGHFHESRQQYAIALQCYAQALQAMPPQALS